MAWNILQPFSHRWSRCIINHNDLFEHLHKDTKSAKTKEKWQNISDSIEKCKAIHTASDANLQRTDPNLVWSSKLQRLQPQRCGTWELESGLRRSSITELHHSVVCVRFVQARQNHWHSPKPAKPCPKCSLVQELLLRPKCRCHRGISQNTSRRCFWARDTFTKIEKAMPKSMCIQKNEKLHRKLHRRDPAWGATQQGSKHTC